jgi:hypothetical protein
VSSECSWLVHKIPGNKQNSFVVQSSHITTFNLPSFCSHKMCHPYISACKPPSYCHVHFLRTIQNHKWCIQCGIQTWPRHSVLLKRHIASQYMCKCNFNLPIWKAHLLCTSFCEIQKCSTALCMDL